MRSFSRLQSNIKRTFVEYRLGTYLIDLAFAFIFVIFVLLEINGYFQCFKSCEIAIDNTVTYLAAILPMIVFIITMMVEAFDKPTSFGIMRKKFEKFRGPFVYGVLHMIIAIIVIFALFLVLFTFKFAYSILLLDIIAVIYSIYFSCQIFFVSIEITFAMKRILRRAYKRSTMENDLSSNNEFGLFGEVMVHMLFDKGIAPSYTLLKSNSIEGNELLFQLFSFQNRCLFKIKKEISAYKKDMANTFYDIDIFKVIKYSLNNVRYMFDFGQNINYSILGKDHIYLLTRTAFVTRSIANELSLEGIFIEHFDKILFQAQSSLFRKDNKIAFESISSFITLMSVYTLAKGELWFVNELSKAELFYPSMSSSLFNKIAFFVIYLIAFYSNCEMFELGSLNLEGLLKSRVWGNRAVFEIENADEKYIVNFIQSLLEMYYFVNEGSYIVIKDDELTIDMNDAFQKFDVIDLWVETFAYGSAYILVDELVEHLNKLDEKVKDDIAHRLDNKWFSNNEFNEGCHPGFYKLIDGEHKHVNSSVVNALNSFRSAILQSDIEKTIQEELDKTNCEEYKNKLDETMKNVINNLPFFDDSLVFEKENLRSYSFTLSGDNRQQLFDSYLKSIKDSFDYSIHEYIRQVAKPNDCNDYIEMANNIISFNPDKASDLFVIYHLNDNDLEEKLSKIEASKLPCLPRGLFYKNGSIRINANYNSSDSFVRPLSDKEVDEYIDKHYTETNGMYRYSLYPNDSRGCFMVSRPKLTEMIKANVLFCRIVFNLKIEVSDGAQIYKVDK